MSNTRTNESDDLFTKFMIGMLVGGSASAAQKMLFRQIYDVENVISKLENVQKESHKHNVQVEYFIERIAEEERKYAENLASLNSIKNENSQLIKELSDLKIKKISDITIQLEENEDPRSTFILRSTHGDGNLLRDAISESNKKIGEKMKIDREIIHYYQNLKIPINIFSLKDMTKYLETKSTNFVRRNVIVPSDGRFTICDWNILEPFLNGRPDVSSAGLMENCSRIHRMCYLFDPPFDQNKYNFSNSLGELRSKTEEIEKLIKHSENNISNNKILEKNKNKIFELLQPGVSENVYRYIRSAEKLGYDKDFLPEKGEMYQKILEILNDKNVHFARGYKDFCETKQMSSVVEFLNFFKFFTLKNPHVNVSEDRFNCEHAMRTALRAVRALRPIDGYDEKFEKFSAMVDSTQEECNINKIMSSEFTELTGRYWLFAIS